MLAASSSAPLPADAILEVGERLRALGFEPDGAAPATALVFATTHLARDPEALSLGLEDLLGGAPFIGFVGATAFHGARLRERRPGLCVLVMPGVLGHVRTAPLEGAASGVAGALLGDLPLGRARFLSVAADAGTAGGLLDFLPLLDEQRVPVAGALSLPPAGQRPSVLGPRPRSSPAAALLDVAGVTPVFGVAQAARLLGPARSVTSASANVILELDGRPAFEALLDDLPASLRAQVSRLSGALCAGFGTEDGGSYLMRNVVGLDPQTGAVAVAGQPRVGTELVFSLRDQAAARADLDELLDSLEEALGDSAPLALVVFDCLARDEGLFGVQNHDVQRVLHRFGAAVPVVGVAGGGELCSYGAGTYLFGMSCVVCALLPG
jgi:small ligand-binding sensory domain FIST